MARLARIPPRDSKCGIAACSIGDQGDRPEPVICWIVTAPQVFALFCAVLAVVMGSGFAVFAKQHATLQVRIQRFLRTPAPSSHRTIMIFTRVFGIGFAVIGVVLFVAALSGNLV